MKLGAIILPFALLSSIMAQAPREATAPSPEEMGQSSTPPPSTSATQSQAHVPSEKNQAADSVPDKYIEFWNTGDVKVMKSFFSPFYMISHGHRVIVDEAMLTRVVTAWRKSIPDLNFKIEDTITEGNKVAMRLTFNGTYKARLFANTGDPAKFTPPRHVHATEILFFELKDGKLWTIWEEYDELAMRTQMGALWRTNEQLDAAHRSAAPPTPAPESKPGVMPAPKP